MASTGWTRFKELSRIITSAVVHKQHDAFFNLEKCLKKHKLDFMNLLKNPPRNPSHKSQVQAATSQGLKVSTVSHSLTLPTEFIDESLILSDILDLNEISAVELLLAGEQQLPNFPSLTRGLVAVLLYYDSKRCLVTSLRSLIQARDGLSWTLGLTSNVSDMISKFTDELLHDGLVEEILKQVSAIDTDKELENLSKGQAIKDTRHRQQIIDLIEDTKHAMMDCLFYWSCQTPFDKDNIMKLLKELKKVSATSEGHKPMDYTSLAIFFTLVQSFSVTGSLHDHASLDNMLEEYVLPVFSDNTLIPTLHKLICKDDWSNPSLGAAVQFAWGMFLRECCPFDALNELEELQEDEELIDHATDNEAFQFMRQAVVTSAYFFHEEYYVRRLHHILSSFIVLMPNKVTELRNHGDEAAREELLRATRGPMPPQQFRQDFGELMKLVGDLYYQDPNGLNLSLEYWALVESDARSGLAIQVPHRQLSLLKFIHQCSDLLPPPLFTSFMSLLVGLSNSKEAALHSFNFLKSNSTSLGGGGPSASFSLDHFFHSLKQYYIGLKQDARMKQTPTGCAISPQEVEGLLMVLKLVKTIAHFDENARVVMYENQTWLPVASMFGLIGCAIPRVLKSEIFLTLAEFARSPEIAASMWQTLENSQVLNTVPNISAGSGGHYGLGPSSQEGSIQIELEEIESKEEDYPQTRAFLSLLDSMTDVVIPSSLGIGHRVPGFQPYLEFVRDSVLLKFDTRAYKDPQEKWLVASSAMEVILKLLLHHEITPHDFKEQLYEVTPGRMVPLPLQPGHVIIHHLLNDSTLLRKILFIVDECCSLLLDVESITDAVANAALLALKILECGLSKQNAFFSILRESSSHSIMATPLDHLLLGINPRTRTADYYVSVARYVTVANCSPELALTAVRLLCFACNSPAVSKEILSALTATKDACVSVLHGFIEHLEWEDPTPPTTPLHDEQPNLKGEKETSADTAEDVRRQLKEEIVRLLIVCVRYHTPNVGRLLLGYIQPPFNKKRINEISLQDPGVLGSLKTCLHSVLQLVSIGADLYNPSGCHMTHPKLAEACYHLLYILCHNQELSENTMRYLRNNHNFFHVQLNCVPFPWLQQLEEPNIVISLKQQAWILCSVALEMRMTTLKNQRSHAQKLVSLLLKSTTLTEQFNETVNNIPMWSTAVNLDFESTQDSTSMLQDGRRKILTILDYISFDTVPVPPLQLQFFDQERTESVISSCETTMQDDSGFSYIDIQTLHTLLMSELNSIQGAAVLSQKHFILEEIGGILEVAVDRNHIQETVYCQQQLMDSWCKVVEVMVGVVNDDQEKEGTKIPVFFEIVQDLLLKVDNTDANSLTASAHGVIFTLMACLRQTFANQPNESDKSQSLGPLASGPLQSIFRSLLNNLVKCPIGMQRLRAWLYSSLLSYLHMTKEKQEKKSGIWRLEQNTCLTVANLSVLSECGEGLMDVVCRDACNGHDVAKMLSLSLLDSIVDLDRHCHWLQYMTTKGYLQKLCSSFLWDDETLQSMIHPQPDALRPLYIYESKMAFLGRVASTTVGARELVSLNCLASFNECKYIDCRPGSHGNQSTLQPHSKFIPSVSVRYLQLLLPVLRLLLALLTTPGSHTKDATNQVLVFIRSHMEVFMSILKDTHSFVSMGNLQELSLITAIISHCKAGQDWLVESVRPVTQELILIQTLVLSLLPNFLTPLHWKKISQEVSKNENGGRGSNSGPLWEEAYELSQHVCSNLMTYCQNALTATDSEFSVNFYRILFTPDLSLALSQIPQGQIFKTNPGPPSLGLLITSLREVCDGYFVAVETVVQIQKKMDGVRNMTSDELKQLIPEVTERNTSTLTQLQNMSRAALQRILEGKNQQISMFVYILEHMLCILWRHLQFFLIHCIPTKLSDSLTEDMLVMRTAMRRLHQPSDNTQPSPYQGGAKEKYDISHMTSGISTNDIEQLKLNISKCLTDSLFKKLLDINDILSQAKDDSTVGFIHALTRRIKKLLKLKAAAKPLLHL